MREKPHILIHTGDVEPTGAFIAAYRQALLMKDVAEFAIVISDRSRILQESFPEVELIRLPLVRVTKTVGSMLGYPIAVLRSARRLRRLLAERECSRLQVNDFYLLEGALTRLFGFRGTILTWVRIDPTRYGGPLANVWLRAAAMASTTFVAVSEFIRSQLGPGKKVALLYDFAPELPLAEPPTSPRFVFVGNYIKGKGQEIAIRALARVSRSFPDAKLECYGGDLALERNRAFRASLERLVAELSLERHVTLNGFLEDLAPAFDGALAALNLSDCESFSLATQEASARGVAVIATRSGGPQEIIVPGVTGWLVQVGDEAEIARAMSEALADPVRTAAMGRAGASQVRKAFSIEIFRNTLTELFDLGEKHFPITSGVPA